MKMSFIKLYKKVKDVDIFDINMVYRMQFDSPPKREKSLEKIVITKAAKLVRTFFKNSSSIEKSPKGHILFYGASNNNQKAFKSIVDNLNGTKFSIIRGEQDYPLIKSLYLSLPFVISLYKKYKKGTPEQRKLIRRYPLQFLFAYGKFISAYRIISSYLPKLLVLANDHSPMNRCLINVSQTLRVKTLYIQHASVTEKFPDLSFDYALLDGQESFEKYRSRSKSSSKVLLAGGTRYDYFSRRFRKSNGKNIGISINQFDDFQIVKDLCLSIKNCSTFEISVRPHPNMINWNRSWFEKNGIRYSDSSIVPSYDYLASLWLQISNVCGIHLDAVILGVPTVQYQLSKDKVFDQYDFSKKNLIKVANDYRDLEFYFKYPQQLIPDEDLVNYFMASYKTSREGRVGLFTAEYIRAILQGEEYESIIEEKYNVKLYKF